MRKAKLSVNGIEAGLLEELDHGQYRFTYLEGYQGAPVSLTLPITENAYEFNQFPAIFEGLLPEGVMLDALLRKHKLDSHDLFGQFIQIGRDLVGAITVEAV